MMMMMMMMMIIEIFFDKHIYSNSSVFACIVCFVLCIVKYTVLYDQSPMDGDVVPGKAYYDVLVDVAWALDFLMPQYYNGIVRPLVDGIGAGSPGINHFNTIKDNMFGGDPTKVVFGFCISDCAFTGTNTDATRAVSIMNELGESHSCNGGAFFWVAEHDVGGSWSSTVGNAIFPNAGCSSISPLQISPPPTSIPSSLPGFDTTEPASVMDTLMEILFELLSAIIEIMSLFQKV